MDIKVLVDPIHPKKILIDILVRGILPELQREVITESFNEFSEVYEEARALEDTARGIRMMMAFLYGRMIFLSFSEN